MAVRENETRRNSLRFNGKDIVLAVDMIEKLEKTVELIYYLMEHKDEESFVLMLISAKGVDMHTILDEGKRDTDILFEVDTDEDLFVMLCQDTKVDGGYHFAERIIKTVYNKDGRDIYCTELEVRSTNHPVKFVILKLIEIFMKSKVEKRTNQIVYKSLN